MRVVHQRAYGAFHSTLLSPSKIARRPEPPFRMPPSSRVRPSRSMRAMPVAPSGDSINPARALPFLSYRAKRDRPSGAVDNSRWVVSLFIIARPTNPSGLTVRPPRGVASIADTQTRHAALSDR